MCMFHGAPSNVKEVAEIFLPMRSWMVGANLIKAESGGRKGCLQPQCVGWSSKHFRLKATVGGTTLRRACNIGLPRNCPD